MVQMSEYDSSVFNEGYLATTLDRKDTKNQAETSFLNGMLLIEACIYTYLYGIVRLDLSCK